MSGWIKLHRKILDNEIWQDVTAFRLFTLLLLRASHKDGVKTRGIEVNRGQYLRSYSKLAEDLEYTEGRGFKKVSKSTVERKVKKLVDAGMVSVNETVSGTMFTITKYDEYQGFDDNAESDSGTVDETNLGRSRDDDGTNLGQEQELKNLRIKELNITTTSTTALALDQGFGEVIQIFEANLCMLSPMQRESLGMWFDDFNQQTEIIYLAIKIAADRNKKNFGFVEYLLKEWSSHKLTTVEQIESHERNGLDKQRKQARPYVRTGAKVERVPEWLNQQQQDKQPAEQKEDPEISDAKRRELKKKLEDISRRQNA
ncbi:DnaD domain-containing protein [Sporosarcina sp. Marseille-Q4943]|uniref:DnaD domain-containing protein n=1 Tax=Sporosarcina sp. Marseille-Q4943 TaxID=2942204 RepID=UPI00208DD428|nr:DnaD domain protein [Sporosarcina sp. Marseille-Q4943]